MYRKGWMQRAHVVDRASDRYACDIDMNHFPNRLSHYFVLVGILLMTSDYARAQTQAAVDKQAVSMIGGRIRSDRMEYKLDEEMAVFQGNVVIEHGEERLTADYIEVYTETEDVHAAGNIVFKQGKDFWRGEELTYNFKMKVGDFGAFSAFADPYYIYAEESERIGPREIFLRNVGVTTCEGENPVVLLQADEAKLVDGHILKAKHVVSFLGPVPIFYAPYLKKDLKGSRWDFVPGYSSEMGAFLLTAYNYRIWTSPEAEVRGATHFDVRTERGVGVGQDIIWTDPEKEWSGSFKAYYTHDDELFEDDEEEAARGDLIDSDRYRLRLEHIHNVTPNDTLFVDINYLSDPDVVEDFFDDEFRNNAQPENRINFIHRDDRFTAGIELNTALNDFYDNLDRLPELTLDIHRQRLGDTGFYYESENSAAYLERVFPEDSTGKDYDAFRLDTAHQITYPTRQFGFLNVIPRAGYQATYYSDTIAFSSVTNMITMTDTNGVVTTNSSIANVIREKGSDIRNIFELGLEASFKAFRVMHNDPIWMGEGLRHVVEPFLDYSYRPRPDLEPDELYQFDGIDQLDKLHILRLGVRNKLQTKRKQGVHDLLALNLFTDLRLEKEEGQDDFSSLFVDAELRLLDGLRIDLDAEIDWSEEQNLNAFTTQIEYEMADDSNVGLEYRFADDRQSLLAVYANLFPEKKWSYSAYWRYDFEGDDLEEQVYSVIHRADCLGLGVGVKQIDDDVTVFGQIWLLALPRTQLDLGR